MVRPFPRLRPTLLLLLLIALPHPSQQGSLIALPTLPDLSQWFSEDTGEDTEEDQSVAVAVATPRDLQHHQHEDLAPLRASLSHMVRAVGTKLPLRGFASLAADLGLPGASHMLAMLTPPRTPQPSPWQRLKKALWGEDSNAVAVDQFSLRSFPAPQNSAIVSQGGSTFNEELLSLVGSFFGEQECLHKLACLSARHLSGWSGAPTVTLLLSTVTNRLPQQWLAPYKALRDAMMYSVSCAKYRCDHQRGAAS